MFAKNMRRGMVNREAFSLVEVVLAIGILAFGLIVILGLLPMGLKSNRDSTEESQAVSLMQTVIVDRQGTDYSLKSAVYQIPEISGSNSVLSGSGSVSGTFYLAEGGGTTSLEGSGSMLPRYRVVYVLYSGSQTVNGASGLDSPIGALINIRVSWPARQTDHSSAVESTAVFMQP
jgi:uncharacterized protein (TIGR02598 family)